MQASTSPDALEQNPKTHGLNLCDENHVRGCDVVERLKGQLRVSITWEDLKPMRLGIYRYEAAHRVVPGFIYSSRRKASSCFLPSVLIAIVGVDYGDLREGRQAS
jgi:hypothetical protein